MQYSRRKPCPLLYLTKLRNLYHGSHHLYLGRILIQMIPIISSLFKVQLEVWSRIRQVLGYMGLALEQAVAHYSKLNFGGVLYGLRMAWSLNIRQLILKVDSKTVVERIGTRCGCLLVASSLLSSIQNMLA